MKLEFFNQTTISPFTQYGFTHPFWQFNKETIMYTWVVLGVIVLLIFLGRHALKKDQSIGQYLILVATQTMRDQLVESAGSFIFRHFAFIGSLFCFILLCNIISIIPFVNEPTIDLNTTLALGLTSFAYVQINSILHNGLLTYIKGFLEPFFLFAPVNIIGSLSTIVSMSFRLFGNIFGGAMIHYLFHAAIAGVIIFEILGIGFNIGLTLFFVLFEGLIQAFVFSMLTLTYLAVEIQDEHD